MTDQIRRDVGQGRTELWHKMTRALGTGAAAKIAQLTVVVVGDREGLLQHLQCNHGGDRRSQRPQGHEVVTGKAKWHAEGV